MVSKQIIVKATLSVALVLSCGACASAMYDPYVGRFASRDPIGYTDGPSLYDAYFVPNSLDASGLCECCCCPGTLTFSNIKVTEDNSNPSLPRFALNFRVNAELDFAEPRVEGGGCRIEWFECSSRGGSLGQKPGEWFRAPSPSDDPPGRVDSDWNTPTSHGCPAKLSKYWGDAPTVFGSTGASLDVKFFVRVVAGEGCKCDGKTISTLSFSLHVKVKKFDTLFPQKSEFDPNPPVLTPGLSGEPKDCSEANLPKS